MHDTDTHRQQGHGAGEAGHGAGPGVLGGAGGCGGGGEGAGSWRPACGDAGEDAQGVRPSSDNERTLGMASHLLALVGIAIPVPFAEILGPLVLYLMKKDEMPYVRDQGRESINFQITVTVLYLLALVLSLPIFLFVGVIFLFALKLANLVLVIVATVRASEGRPFRYPFSLKILR